MASLNKKKNVSTRTHEGAKSVIVNPKEQLERTVMACMLWEDNFYEDGESVADRIHELVRLVKPEDVYNIAINARNKSKLRHVPLLLARDMARIPSHKGVVAKLLNEIIQRPDELCEFMKIYWKDKKQPLSAQVKKGLASAFKKFNEYSLAKYNRDTEVKLKDVLFLTHPKPDNTEQQKLWDKLVKDELATPDTWEVEISKNKSNPESWERLLTEKKLGALALIRNLRNMQECKTKKTLIRSAMSEMKTDKVIPYRFIAAARYAPDFEPELEDAMFRSITEKEKLPGLTVLLIDVSGSMDHPISDKSDLQRVDAACGVAMLARELCEEVKVYSFSELIVHIPPRRGFALRDAISSSQRHSGTYTGRAIEAINKEDKYDRMIVITDEQSHDSVPNPTAKGYIVNVAVYEKGIGYGAWTHINGWSESVLDYIRTVESKAKVNND